MEFELEIGSLILNAVFTMISIVVNVTTIRKNKQIELRANVKQFELEKRYQNNRELVEEVYMIMCNIENLSHESDCYLLKNESQRKALYEEARKEAVNSLIWVKKRISILSVYSNREVYEKTISLLEKAREIISSFEDMEYTQFVGRSSNDIKDFTYLAHNVITIIQKENENIANDTNISKLSGK